MSKRPQPAFAKDRCIYLDFEGEGRSINKGSPAPHLAGVYRPRSYQWGKVFYKTTFFRESWNKITHVRGAFSYMDSLADFIGALIDEAQQNQQKIVYWSDYGRAFVEEQCPEHLERFKEHSVNLLPTARRYVNRRNIALDESETKVLNRYLKAVKPEAKLVKIPRIGAAEACRRVDAALQKYSRFKRWPKQRKTLFLELLEYNQDDCWALFSLAKKLLKVAPVG